jgi:hypothetical protein
VERRFRVHAGTHRQALIAAFVLAAVPAGAAPKRADAKQEFDRGVAAYQKSDFAGAAAAFGKSFALEVDAETLFAWAQAERKLDRCDKATELYAKLLAMELPAENKAVIEGQIAECKAILDAQKPVEPPAPAPVEPATAPAPVEAAPAPTPAPAQAVTAAPEGHAWYRDPVGDGLVAVGVVGLGVGVAFLVSAHSAEQAIPSAADYDAAKVLHDRASSRGTLGSVSMIAGGALVVGGIVWLVHHAHASSGTTISGWVAPGTGGLAVTGGF